MGETQEESAKAVSTESEDGVLRVVEIKQPGPNELRVIIEGTNLERLTGPEARKLAYEQRLSHGMANAGAEALGGTYVPDEEYKAAADESRDVERWRRDFKLVGML